MKQNVMISVRGEQYYEGVDPNKTELLTEGELEQVNGGWHLSYEESELTGMEGTTTIFEIGKRIFIVQMNSVKRNVSVAFGRICGARHKRYINNVRKSQKQRQCRRNDFSCARSDRGNPR